MRNKTQTKFQLFNFSDDILLISLVLVLWHMRVPPYSDMSWNTTNHIASIPFIY